MKRLILGVVLGLLTLKALALTHVTKIHHAPPPPAESYSSSANWASTDVMAPVPPVPPVPPVAPPIVIQDGPVTVVRINGLGQVLNGGEEPACCETDQGPGGLVQKVETAIESKLGRLTDKTVRVVSSKRSGKNESSSPAPVPVRTKTPDWFDFDNAGVGRDGPSDGPRTIYSSPRTTAERAADDLDKTFHESVAEWLVPEVPRGWEPPADVVRSLVREEYTDARPLGEIAADSLDTLVENLGKRYPLTYVAAYRVDFSPETRTRLIETYRQEQVVQRLTWLGGAALFALICLGAVSGYIRADESTKGYYTNRLRMASAAAVGAAGFAVYHFFA